MKKPGLKVNLGHLLYYLDSAHFADYLGRYRSKDDE